MELGTRGSSFIVCVEEREAVEGGSGKGGKRGKGKKRIYKRGDGNNEKRQGEKRKNEDG